jgi:hypothetical protein
MSMKEKVSAIIIEDEKNIWLYIFKEVLN